MSCSHAERAALIQEINRLEEEIDSYSAGVARSQKEIAGWQMCLEAERRNLAAAQGELAAAVAQLQDADCSN